MSSLITSRTVWVYVLSIIGSFNSSLINEFSSSVFLNLAIKNASYSPVTSYIPTTFLLKKVFSTQFLSFPPFTLTPMIVVSTNPNLQIHLNL